MDASFVACTRMRNSEPKPKKKVSYLRIMTEQPVLRKKLLYALFITLLYLLGRTIPIPWIQAKTSQDIGDLRSFLAMTYGAAGDINSIFMLGYLPWMTASIIIQLLTLTSGEKQSRLSQTRIRRITAGLSLFIALLQDVLLSHRLSYRTDLGVSLALERLLTLLVLLAGSYTVVWLGDINAKRSIGGANLIIMINILDSLRLQLVRSYQGFAPKERSGALILSAGYVLFAIFLTILLDRSEIRLYVQRVLIDSELAQKDYIAIRLNPVGTIAVMYGMAFFAFPLYLCEFLEEFFPESRALQAVITGLRLNSREGVIWFLITLIGLTVMLAFLYINPKDIAEQLQKSGDYIAGFPPGRETMRMLRRQIVFAGVTGGTAVSLCVSFPLFLRVALASTNPIFMLLISIMILTGIVLQFLDELISEIDVNRYDALL